MQKQNSRCVLRTGLAIEDVQFIHTNGVITHWIWHREGWVVFCHFLNWWVPSVAAIVVGSFSLSSMRL